MVQISLHVESKMIYTPFTNLDMKYLVMCTVYTDVCGKQKVTPCLSTST